MLSGATRSRQRDDTLPPDRRPRSEREPRPSTPGPHFAHDFTRVPVRDNIQAKLKVNTPGDSYEQEADRVAHELSEESCACGSKCSSCSTKRVQRKSGAPTADSADVDPILSGPGHALDSNTRSFMEPYFGHDFSRVRVHSDPAAAASADSLGARAYTVGHHLVFGPGQYRPGNAEGQRLLAHELTHVMQQSAADPMIQRDDKKPEAAPSPPKAGTAGAAPQLEVQDALNKPPCACLVFMHHNEPSAHLIAKTMHEHCRYNLAIVQLRKTKGDPRLTDLPGGDVDPNGLFPRHIVEECLNDDKPCEDFIANAKNAGATDAKTAQEFAQRQYFLAIKKCSHGLTLPVVAIHNNTIADTEKYRNALKRTTNPLSPEAIKGRTYDDTMPTADEKAIAKPELPKDGKPRPLVELQNWLLKNVGGVQSKAVPADKKDKPEGKKRIKSTGDKDLLSPGKTNIFLWCNSVDISQCHIGDPEHPDNVVWVTNRADFDKLRAKPINAALQTRVDPAGNSATDLSSAFVFLEEKIGKDFAAVIQQLQHDAAIDQARLYVALGQYYGKVIGGLNPTEEFWQYVIALAKLLDTMQKLSTAQGDRAVKLSQLRYINIETPQTSVTKAGDAGQRVSNYQAVRATLQALDLHCCDAAGATTNDQKVEEKMREGTPPPPKAAPKAKAPIKKT